MLPIYSWIQEQSYKENDPKTSQFSQHLSTISFQGELEQFQEQRPVYDTVQQRVFAPGNENQQIYANIFTKQKQNLEALRNFKLVNQEINNTQKDNNIDSDEDVYEQFISGSYNPPQQYKAPNIAKHIIEKRKNEDLVFSLTFVINLQKIKNSNKSFHFFSSYTKNLTQKICKYIYKENMKKLRNIINADLQILKQIALNMDYSYDISNKLIFKLQAQQEINDKRYLNNNIRLLQETNQMDLQQPQEEDIQILYQQLQFIGEEDLMYQQQDDQQQAKEQQTSCSNIISCSEDKVYASSNFSDDNLTKSNTQSDLDYLTLDQINLNEELRQKLYEESKNQQHIVRTINNQLATYSLQKYTDKQLEVAIQNVTNQAMLKKITELFQLNDYQIVILGPKKIANLLGRTLALQLPSDNTGNIVFARDPQQFDECYCSNEKYFSNLFIPITQFDKNERRQWKNQSTSKSEINSPNDSIYASNSSVEQSQTDEENNMTSSQQIIGQNINKPPFLIPYKQCYCGKYQHTEPLIPGINIQCINADENTYHILDFMLSNDNTSLIVNLCSEDRTVINLNSTDYFMDFKQQIYYMCLMNQRKRVRYSVQQYLAALDASQGIYKFNKQKDQLIFNSDLTYHNTINKLQLLSYIISEISSQTFKETYKQFYKQYSQSPIPVNFIESREKQEDNDTLKYFFFIQMKQILILSNNNREYIKNYYDISDTQVQLELQNKIQNQDKYLLRFDTVDQFISSDLQNDAVIPQFNNQYINNWKNIFYDCASQLLCIAEDQKLKRHNNFLLELTKLLHYYDEKTSNMITDKIKDIQWL